MHSAFSTLLGPVLVLWLGALIFYVLDRFLKPQDAGLAETSVLTLSLGFLIHARASMGTPIQFGESLAEAGWPGVSPFLVLGSTSWILALILLGAAWAASLASIGSSTRGRAGRLASLAAALLFFFAGDWATLAVAWVLVDVSMLCTLTQDQAAAKSLGRTGLFSLAGAVVLGIALLLWQHAPAAVWIDPSRTPPIEVVAASAFPPQVAILLALAALFRLMPFPLPTWQDASKSSPTCQELSATQMATFTVPALLGSYLWVSLAQWNVLAQVAHFPAALSLWAILALLITGVRAWGVQEPTALIGCGVAYSLETILLAAGLQLPAGHQLLVALSAILGVSTLGLSWTQTRFFQVFDLRSYWRLLPAALSLLSLAGSPLTIGFLARAALYHQIFARAQWLLLLGLLIVEALLLAAFLRTVLDVEQLDAEPEEEGRAKAPNHAEGDGDRSWWAGRHEIGFSAGAFLALAIVVLGLAPRLIHIHEPLPSLGGWFGLPTLPVWAALLLSVVAALTLYRSRDAILSPMEVWWPLIQRALRLDWAFTLIEHLMQSIGELIWHITQVVQGAGYMSWVVLVFLIMVLFVIAR